VSRALGRRHPGDLRQERAAVRAAAVGQPIQRAAGLPESNWTPQIRPGTLVLNHFTYTLTFVGFSSPYITISAIDP
jgi:hypothetical protein